MEQIQNKKGEWVNLADVKGITENDLTLLKEQGRYRSKQLETQKPQAQKESGVLETLKDFTYYGMAEDVGNHFNFKPQVKAILNTIGGTIDAATTAALFSPAAPAAAGSKIIPTLSRGALNAVKKVGSTIDTPAIAAKKILNYFKPQVGEKVATKGAEVAAQRLASEISEKQLADIAKNKSKDKIKSILKDVELGKTSKEQAKQILDKLNLPEAIGQIANREGRDFTTEGTKSIILETMPERVAAGLGHVGGRVAIGNRENILDVLRDENFIVTP